MHACVHVCRARKWHVLGGACREALGWIPTLVWLWFHTSFPCRPGEAKLHRWPSGWHFRTRPTAHSQPSLPLLLCFTGSMDSERSAGPGWRSIRGDRQGPQAQDWAMVELCTLTMIRFSLKGTHVCAAQVLRPGRQEGHRMGEADAVPTEKIPLM